MKRKRKKMGRGSNRAPTTQYRYFLSNDENAVCQVKKFGGSLRASVGSDLRLSTDDAQRLRSPLSFSFWSGPRPRNVSSRVPAVRTFFQGIRAHGQPCAGVESHIARRVSRRSLAGVTGACPCVDQFTLGYGCLRHVLELSK